MSSRTTAFVVLHETYYANATVYAVCLTEVSAKELVHELETTIIDRDFESYCFREAELVL